MNPAETQTGINRFRHGGRNDEGFSQSHHAKNRPAFTLAEVLITLGIIGVVAAMTLPALIQRQQEKSTINRLKKTYSILQQALTMAIQEHGTVDNWCNLQLATDYNICTVSIQEKLKPYLKNIKHCDKRSNRNCFAEKYTNRFDNRVTLMGGNVSTYVLADGTSIGYRAGSGDAYPSKWCTSKDGKTNGYEGSCGFIYIDINGQQKPNRDGDDIFAFKMYQTILQPLGAPNDGVWVESFDQQCLGKRISGFLGSCTAWAIFNENMDYLHCSDLSWGGKRKCSK